MSSFIFNSRRLVVALLYCLLLACPALADEGMWLFTEPPRQALKEKYGFEPTAAWLDHLRLASIKFGTGGSAEFVSEDGLILSNQHVGSRAVQRLSTPDHNYIRDGFCARTRAEEKPCAGLELRVLMSMENVTARVAEALKPGMADEEAFAARRSAIAQIEKESLAQTGFRSEVITLYQGAEYHLYRYKTYSEVRLVFAPEEQIAFFGGDPDNFEYPRFNLDICFFRAYEDGKPAKVAHFLKWSRTGALENELVFVSGHPGRTDRLRTMAELEYLRDLEFPRFLLRQKSVEVLLHAYSARSAENSRRARADLRGVENSRKVRDGALAGLLDPELMKRKQDAEEQFRAAVGREPALAEVKGAWDRIATAQQAIAKQAREYDLLERGSGFNTVLFTHARQLHRAAAERAKPNGERLEEYRDSGLASLERGLFAAQPLYPDLETLKLANSLTFLAGELGYENPVVKKILAGASPQKRAAALVATTRLGSVDVRKKIYAAGAGGADAAADPMLELAAAADEASRTARKAVERETEAIRQAHALIGKARYTLKGSTTSPDATSTLRLAFGPVRGYSEGGASVPFQTTFDGLFQRATEHQGNPPFDLPEKWLARRKKVNPAAPLNFVCTADIIGGNSGSPVVNRQGELVGLIFDGNLQSLTANFVYTDEQCRALAVHSTGIIEALEKVYQARPLVEELLSRTPTR
jgi:hypothetical protein